MVLKKQPDSLDEFAALADQLRDKADWHLLADYFRLRSKGLRQQAKSVLETQILQASKWDFSRRKELLLWVSQNDRKHRSIVPPNFHVELLKPTVVQWLESEPNSADANYLFGIYVAPHDDNLIPGEFIDRALQIEPGHQYALLRQLRWLIDYVDYAQHELPSGYLGSVEDDLVCLKEGLKLIPRLDDSKLREARETRLLEMITVGESWLQYASLGCGYDEDRWEEVLEAHKVRLARRKEI